MSSQNKTELEKFHYYNKYYKHHKKFVVAKIKGLSEEKRLLKHKKKCSYGFSQLIRYHMLAYAFLRGMPYKAVENNCADNNEPNPKLLLKIVSQNICPNNVIENNYGYEAAIMEWLNEEQ